MILLYLDALMNKKCERTCPFSSSWLFVNLSLSNDTICFIQLLPGAGESGWTWIRGGEIGSALPATTQLELKEHSHKRIKRVLMVYFNNTFSTLPSVPQGNFIDILSC